MTQPLSWELADAAYLEAGVAWIHALLETRLAEAEHSHNEHQSRIVAALESLLAPLLPLPPSEVKVMDAETRCKRARHLLQSIAAYCAEAGFGSPSMIALAKRFNLSEFEQHLILLSAAAELDPRLGRLCARVQDDPKMPYPTFALALSLFDNRQWEAFLATRPLRAYRLVEIYQPAATPLIAAALSLDERCLHFLKGLRYLDDRLEAFIDAAYSAETRPTPLPATQAATALDAAHHLAAWPNRRLPLVRLEGDDRDGQWQVACSAIHNYAEMLGQQLNRPYPMNIYRLPVERLPPAAAEVDELARIWRREARLFNLAIYLDPGPPPLAADSEAAAKVAATLRLLDRIGPLAFVPEPLPLPAHQPSLVVEVNRPTPVEQHEQWLDILGPGRQTIAGQLATQFSLSVPAIHQVAKHVAASSSEEEAVRNLWAECSKATRPRLNSLAQRLDVKATWNDLVLPDQPLEQLKHLIVQVRCRWRVHEEWGARTWLSGGLGVSALFAGESGTGKSMAAEVLAGELRMDLYRIDLSAVIDKFVGETEKRLCRLFDAFEHCGAILFFDECDALFGKRTDVKDSHDRYANIEVSYLLQRLESYRGVALLATNHRGALDSAFLRRLRTVVTFPMPEEKHRRQIWERHLPPSPRSGRLPAQGLDYGWLARVDLSGGNIQTVALNAAFRAAGKGRAAVTMPDVVYALREELRKLSRPLRLPPLAAALELEAAS